uniref:Transcription factor CBF/NF-Y/archaeal histone domain-containing protein n=1 Tax=Acrobeloides nanus TaxID=290746 RepID=A0A914EQU7_9BILA
MKSDDLEDNPMDHCNSNYLHEHHDGPTSSLNKGDGKMILEQERFLPIANISRIMKRVIPETGKLSKEAKECIQECVTEFLLFITSEASEKCLQEKRKTITGEDLLTAFQTLGFDDYLDPLKEFLQKYREANKLEKPKIEFSEEGHQEPETVSANSLNNHNQVRTNLLLPQTPQNDTIMHNEMTSITIEQPRNAPTTLQSMQMFVDPSTGQHYITVQNPNGTQTLLPVQLTANADTAKTIVGSSSSAQIVQQNSSSISDSTGTGSHCVATYYTTDMR